MKKIIYKSFRDFKKLLTPFLVSVIFATSFVSLISGYMKGEKIPLDEIRYLLLSFGMIFGFVFGIIVIANLVLYSIVHRNIYINPIQSAKKPKDKILVHIVNDNDDDMTSVRVEFKNLFVEEGGKVEVVIRADNNFFSKGLIEKSNAISANTSAKIELAENFDGILKLLLDDEYDLDVLLSMEEFEKNQTYRLLIKVSAKIGDVFFERVVEFPFKHRVDEHIVEISGDDMNWESKNPSYLEWILSQS